MADPDILEGTVDELRAALPDYDGDLHELRARREAIEELMAETQEAYYREESIPEVVYETRMDRYHEEKQEVDRTIPVVESALERERLIRGVRAVTRRLRSRLPV